MKARARKAAAACITRPTTRILTSAAKSRTCFNTFSATSRRRLTSRHGSSPSFPVSTASALCTSTPFTHLFHIFSYNTSNVVASDPAYCSDFIPAVGDIDPFIKIPRPDGKDGAAAVAALHLMFPPLQFTLTSQTLLVSPCWTNPLPIKQIPRVLCILRVLSQTRDVFPQSLICSCAPF